MLTEYDIKTLKDYFAKHRDVAFAFLFGSQASGKASSLSDIDIAVYLYPENRHPVEYEEEIYYDVEDQIWVDIENLIKKDIEMVVLNRVPSTIAASAIKGIPLAINDWGLYLDFMEVVTSEAEDFMTSYINEWQKRGSIEKRG
jgi:predicted nucleotidyltransferase